MSASTHRRSTVHDLSALQLHRDGTRAKQLVHKPTDSTEPFLGTEPTKRKSRRNLVRNLSGDWVAADVAPRPPTHKTRKNTLSQADTAKRSEASGLDGDAREQESGSFNSVDSEQEEQGTRANSGRTKKTRRYLKRKKLSDEAGLSEPLASPNTGHGRCPVTSLPTLPLPSSDLLKSIHGFAASYYSDRGQLLNATRDVRALRKRRKLDRLALITPQEGNVRLRIADFDPENRATIRTDQAATEDVVKHYRLNAEKNGEDDEETDEQDEEGHSERDVNSDGRYDSSEDDGGTNSYLGDYTAAEDSGTEDIYAPPSTKDRRQSEAVVSEKRVRDMYKSFDGSVLMFVGLLVQAHVHNTSTSTLEAMHLQDEMEEAENSTIRGGRKKRKAKSPLPAPEGGPVIMQYGIPPVLER